MSNYLSEVFGFDNRSQVERFIDKKHKEVSEKEFKEIMLRLLDEIIELDSRHYDNNVSFSDYFDGLNCFCVFDDISFFIYDAFGKLISYNNSSPNICEPIIRTCEYFPDPSLIKYLEYLDVKGKLLNDYIYKVERLIEEKCLQKNKKNV